MLKEVFAKAVNHYDKIDYICMINSSAIVEYSVIYSSEAKEYINENITGMHILDVYPDLDYHESSILKSLSTAKEIYNVCQKLIDCKGKIHYLKSSDFPIIQNKQVFGVVEVSKIIIICGLEDIITVDYQGLGQWIMVMPKTLCFINYYLFIIRINLQWSSLNQKSHNFKKRWG